MTSADGFSRLSVGDTQPSPAESADEVVVAWSSFDSAALGLVSAPRTLHLRVIPTRGRWTMVVHARGRPRPDPGVVRWISSLKPMRLRLPPPGAASVYSAELSELPPAMAHLVHNFRVGLIVLSPDGTARAMLEGLRSDIESFAGSALRAAPAPILPAAEIWATDLTDRQRWAVELAVKEGYYVIPRRANLRALAKRSGMSAAALSELLRRAEACIVGSFVALLPEDVSPTRRS